MKLRHPRRRSPSLGLTFAAALLIAPTLTFGQTAAATVTNTPAPPKNPWETTAAAGVTLTRGNSDTLLATLSLDTKKKWAHDEAAFGAAAGYGTESDKRTADFANGYGQYNHLFTERLYAGLRVSANYDGIAHLSYRVTVSPLAGYYLIKNTNTTLSVEIGPAVVFEKFWYEPPDTYPAFRAAERLDQRLSDTTKIWESVSYVPDVTKWSERYVVTAEAGIDTAITKKWSLRVLAQDIYNSQPANGREKNDFRLIAGTAYKF